MTKSDSQNRWLLINVLVITRLCNCFGSKSTIDDATETKTVSEHDMVRDEIIKQRMEYAAQQENDYSHVFR